MATPKKGEPKALRRSSIYARGEMQRLGIEPIEMLKEVYERAIAAYDSSRGYSDKSDAGSAYLGVAGKAAADLARYKYPSLAAIAVKDMSDKDISIKPMTTGQAIEIIQNDPFNPKSIQASDVIDAMKSARKAPLLPTGKKDE